MLVIFLKEKKKTHTHKKTNKTKNTHKKNNKKNKQTKNNKNNNNKQTKNNKWQQHFSKYINIKVEMNLCSGKTTKLEDLLPIERDCGLNAQL